MLHVNEEYEDAREEFKKYKELVPDDPRGEIGIESCEAAIAWTADPSGYIVESMRVFSSRQRDFSPAYINEAYTEVYFTSTREDASGSETHGATGQSFADIFSSSMDRKGKWSIPVPVESLNSEFEDGTPCISSDFSEIYFTRCKKGKNQQLGCQIFKSKSDNSEWQEATVVFEAFGDSLSTAHPAISPDDNTLYFVSDMPGSIGQPDLFVVDVFDGNTFSGFDKYFCRHLKLRSVYGEAQTSLIPSIILFLSAKKKSLKWT
jgi:hypothetical protein